MGMRAAAAILENVNAIDSHSLARVICVDWDRPQCDAGTGIAELQPECIRRRFREPGWVSRN